MGADREFTREQARTMWACSGHDRNPVANPMSTDKHVNSKWLWMRETADIARRGQMRSKPRGGGGGGDKWTERTAKCVRTMNPQVLAHCEQGVTQLFDIIAAAAFTSTTEDTKKWIEALLHIGRNQGHKLPCRRGTPVDETMACNHHTFACSFSSPTCALPPETVRTKTPKDSTKLFGAFEDTYL